MILLVGAALAQPAENPWVLQPYANPIGNLGVWSDGQRRVTAIELGADAGFAYTHRSLPLSGRTRAYGAVWLVGGQRTGSDLRLGTFMGPHGEWWSSSIGVDVFRNAFNYGGFDMPPSIGVDFPVGVSAGADGMTVYAGASTTWLALPERRVDWDEVDSFGFGHEFQWSVGLSVGRGPRVSLAYTHRVTSAGVRSGLGFGLGF